MKRVLYCSEICPADIGAGSSLVYRLLKSCVECDFRVLSLPPPNNRRSLPKQSWVNVLDFPFEGLINRARTTRFHRAGNSLLTVSATFASKRHFKQAISQDIDAVLTVAHGVGWIVAAGIAATAHIPLVILAHDYWATTHPVYRPLKQYSTRIFRQALQQARMTFCVSPHLQRAYDATFGGRLSLLLPTRDADNPVMPVKTLSRNAGPLTIAYAGGLHNSGYSRLVHSAALQAATLGMRFILFSADKAEWLADTPGVEYRGSVDSARLIETLHHEADVVFSPQSFDKAETIEMQTNFPSKLADYTATGLPVLLCAPPYSSSAVWHSEHPASSALITDDSPEAIRAGLKHLIDVERRTHLAASALITGAHLFSPTEAGRRLAAALTQ